MSSPDESEIRASFERQRRNLLIISVILYLVNSQQLTFSKITILGTVANIPNQSTVLFLLWVFFIYWLIRYYQIFNELNDKGIKSKFKEVFLNNVTTSYSSSNKDLQFLKASWCSYIFEYTDGIDMENVTGEPIKKKKGICYFKLIWPGIKTILKVTMKTSKVTEFLFPFFVACLPIISLIHDPIGKLKKGFTLLLIAIGL